MTDKRLPVRTTLARALVDTVLVRGYDMFDELVEESPWSVMSLALNGRRLNAHEDRVCDMLASIIGLAEPRIWPLKLTHLIASYGRSFSGISAGFSVLDGAIIGPNSALLAATFLHEAGSAPTDEARFARIETAIDELVARGEPVPAFGVIGRKVDERWVAIQAWCDEHHHDHGPFWRMYQHGVKHMMAHHGQQPNVIGPVAAFFLDCGHPPDATPLFTSALVYWAFVGNAIDGRRESPEVLRRLPEEFVRYKGPAPRKSPRALAADATSS